MLTWLPIIGPIIQGIISIFTKKMDTDVSKLQINRSNDLEEAKVSAQIIQTTNDDIALRLMRDIVCFPVVVWSALIGWDTIIGARRGDGTFWHTWAVDYMLHPSAYPDSVGYLPYAVIVFLLGNIGINMWSRK
jgi:hypothetical protein